MSKAFMPEDAGPVDPILPPRSPDPVPITPAGHRRLLDERARLVRGDEATRTRALVLDRILATVRVVTPSLIEGGAGFGCEITVEDDARTRRMYTIVGPDEIDPAAGRISAESPLGSRLIGKRKGDIVELERAGRAVELEVRDVRTPDR